MKLFSFLLLIFSCEILFAGSLPKQVQHYVELKNWKFQKGNDPAWAATAFDDSRWASIPIYIKQLENGNLAVGMFSLSDQPMKGTLLSWSALNIEGSYLVRDVWRQKNIDEYHDQLSVNIPCHGVVLLRLIRIH